MATTHSDTSVNSLVINKLTKAQYDALETKSETELYLVPDEIDNAPTSGSNNPVKSGGVYSALQDKQDTLVSGANIKTINNQSLLGSGNINIDISGKEDVTTIIAPVNATDATLPISALTAEIGKYYRIDVPIETLAITLPAMGVVTSIKTVVIYLTGGTTPAVIIAAADSKDVYYQDGYEIEAGKTYEVSCLYNGAAWVVGALTINTGE